VSGLLRSDDGTGGFVGLGKAYFRRHYTILFYSLLFTMVAVPMCAALDVTGAVIEFFFAASLLAAVETCHDN
jgi:hypothetical protein